MFDPISLTLGAANLAGGIYGARSARRQQARLKAELERRRTALMESKNIAIGRVAEGTAAAKAPLEAIAERVRTEESFRDPVMEQAVAAGARQQLGAELRQTQAAQSGSAASPIQQQRLLMAAVLSQAMLGSESRRLARHMESTKALAGVYGRLGELTQAGAQSAAGIETQFASALNQQPLPDESDPVAAGIGGLLSFLGTDTGKEALGGLFKMFQGQGGPVSYTTDANGYVEF